jgi:hypothetical protein
MARKFEYKPGYYGWAMERCEEGLLIAVFHEIESRIPPDQSWKADFLDHFYEHGNGVTFETISEINANRRRLNLETVEFRETVVYEHARSFDKLRKSELRRQWRDEYFALDTVGRVRWRNTAEDETARLLSPHLTYEQWKARRGVQTLPPTVLSPRERAIRDTAIEAATAEPVISAPADASLPASPKLIRRPLPPVVLSSREGAIRDKAVETAAPEPVRSVPADAPLPDSLNLIIRRLKLAKKPETRALIVSQTPPTDALTVAESGRIEDPDLIDSLVIRSLDAA